MARILIIDDDPSVGDLLSRVIRGMGHESTHVLTLRQGVSQTRAENYDVVFLDVYMPDGNGLEALPEVKAAASSPEVIIITGQSDRSGAELAIANGAWGYIPKRCSIKEMNLALTRALQYRSEKQAQRPLTALKREGIVGRSPRLNHCLDLLAQAAASEAPVLLTGETGTGKEVFARAIHENSARAGGEFVVVDCAALPENLVESTLFGHDRGAFTGADRARIGLVKLADGGSLFLDEVGELPLSVQKNFLRVLQESRFRPVGQGPEVESRFRLITATNRNLEDMVREGAFRQDLLFRIRSHVIELSPLRDNLEDLKELTLHYIATLCERYQIPTKGVSPDFFEALAQYDWPGNVRELIYTLERALAAARGAPTLYATHLPLSLRVRAAQTLADENPAAAITRENLSPALPAALPQLQQARQAAVQAFEEQYLRDLLALSQGNVKRAAQMAGVSRQHLHDLLKRHHIKHPEI